MCRATWWSSLELLEGGGCYLFCSRFLGICLSSWLSPEHLLPAYWSGVHVHQRCGTVPVDSAEVRDPWRDAVLQRGETDAAGAAGALHEVRPSAPAVPARVAGGLLQGYSRCPRPWLRNSQVSGKGRQDWMGLTPAQERPLGGALGQVLRQSWAGGQGWGSRRAWQQRYTEQGKSDRRWLWEFWG